MPFKKLSCWKNIIASAIPVTVQSPGAAVFTYYEDFNNFGLLIRMLQ